MKTILTLVRKDFALLLKDKVALTMSFVVPFVLIYILGNIFGNVGGGSGRSSGIPLLVADYADTKATQTLVNALDKDPGLQVIRERKNSEGESIKYTEESIRESLTNNKQRFALIIPEDAIPTDGFGIRVQYLFNPVNQIESQIVNGLLQQNVFTNLPSLLGDQLISQLEDFPSDQSYTSYTGEMAKLVSKYFDVEESEIAAMMSLENIQEQIAAFSSPAAQQESESATGDIQETDTEESQIDGIFSQIVKIESDQVVGKEVKSPQVTRIVGGYAIMFLLFAVNASASSLFEEKRMGLFNRLLSMPLRRTHILWSKYIYNMAFGLFQLIILFFAGSILFGVDIYTNFHTLLVVSLFASAACTAFGMLLAAICKTQQQAQGLGTLVILTMTSLGGAWFPVSIMPDFLQPFSRLTIVYWSVEALTDALWANANLIQLAPKLAVLFGITLVVNTFSIWRFKKGNLFH